MTSKLTCLVKKSSKGYMDILRGILSIFDVFKFNLNESEFLGITVTLSWILGVISLLVIIGDKTFPNTILNWVSAFSFVWMPLVLFPIYISFYQNMCETSNGIIKFIISFFGTYYEMGCYIFKSIIELFEFLIPTSKEGFITCSVILGIVGTLSMLIFIPWIIIPNHNVLSYFQIFIVFEFLWLPFVLFPFYNAYYECYCVVK